jgi:anti-sigma regulatory factor (Ser/Thr protein kinase)
MELLELPFEPASASIARRHIVHVLRARGTDPGTCDDAALVVSELVGNALRHGRAASGGRLTVRWRLGDGLLRIEVTDGGGPNRPAVRPHTDALVQSGRGLEIVAALADAWGYDRGGQGTTVWAVMEAPPAVGAAGAAHELDPSEYEQTG